MTPDQEQKLDLLVALVKSLGSNQATAHERLNKLERQVKLVKEWTRRIIVGPPPPGAAPRETLPSLSSEDSGSFEITGFGAGAKFRGQLPVRVAMGLLACAALIVVGYLARIVTR